MALRAGQEEILTLCPNVSRLMVRDGRQVIDSEGSGFSPFDSPYTMKIRHGITEFHGVLMCKT